MTVRSEIYGAFNTKHKPSEHAMGKLEEISWEPIPYQELNFTVGDKLRAFGYIETFRDGSPYKTHKEGHKITWCRITDKGSSALRKWKDR